jgi:hypothetical protein
MRYNWKSGVGVEPMARVLSAPVPKPFGVSAQDSRGRASQAALP